jgi:prolyl oligopeptidase
VRLEYPQTKTVDVVDDYHGTKVADPYRWLEDTDAADTRAWIEAQNRLTESWLSEVPQRERIRARLSELWDHPRAGAPWRRGECWFQLRNSGLQNQDVLYVMETPDAEGRVLLDPNGLSADGTAALTGLGLTEDGALLAYAISEAGSDWMTWLVRDVASGQDRLDVVRWSKWCSAAWAPDASGFFYAAYDAPAEGAEYDQANLHHRLFFHRLGEDQRDDRLVDEAPDEPEWMFDPAVTEDGRWLVIDVHRSTELRNRVHLVDLQAERWDVRELVGGFDARYELVGSDRDTLYLLTDLDAPLCRIVAVDLSGDEPVWRDVIDEAGDVLERARLVGGRLVCVYLHHARNVLRRFTLEGLPDGEIALPGMGTVEQFTGRGTDDSLHLTYESFTTPKAVYRHDLGAGVTELARPPGLDIDPDRFVTEQVFVSHNGIDVPMFLTRRADLEHGSGDLPVLLYGYGGFAIPLPPLFRVAWLVWLELGGVLAVANLRGGGEYGTAWHDAGRLANKQNVFDDFVACAGWLVEHGWTSPQRIGIQGGSNGGLLVGACMTQRPDLFGACVPEVGVMDMLRFHRFTIGWAWVADYGSADDPEQFGGLHAYSPLHNLTPGTAYPATFVTTGDHDDRVVPGHSFKFAAALQAAQRGEEPVLIRIDTSAGHGAGKPTSKVIDERADVLAFLVRALGVEG